jgi:tRNA-specific 2-thiouridylase
MTRRKRVVVAMSGGVDSSTVAALMVEAGHEVIGLSMKTHRNAPKGAKACCTPDDMRDARRVADKLDIPFYLLNYEALFEREVIEPFARAYAEGRTPNPCVDCNDKVKFVPLLERAQMLGADVLVTGHYARIVGDPGARRLARGVDPNKDQSYFLYRLTQAQLAMLEFPLGGMHKDEVRGHAERLGLGVDVAHKRESQEICFVGSEGYADTVERILGHSLPEGDIVDGDDRVVGRHQGIHRFTLGQRRGLGIAHEEPLYVTGVDVSRNVVRVGAAGSLNAHGIRMEHAKWTADAPKLGDRLLLQQRYHGTPCVAEVIAITVDGAGVTLNFNTPGRSGGLGQAAVLYQEDVVVGGGVIVEVIRYNTSPRDGTCRSTSP